MFAAVSDPSPTWLAASIPYRSLTTRAIDLAAFSLSGKRMASIRHSVTSARRAGLRIVPWTDEVADGVSAVSAVWLRTKRGGEMGFTLGRFDPACSRVVECRVAVDGTGAVVGFVTWRCFDDGHGRVLDIMRRTSTSPNPTMDLLVGQSLLDYAAAGIETASLGAVPLGHGALAERLYPTASLRRYKEKFAPTWEPLWLVAPSRRRLPGAVRAVAIAYCPGGLLRAMRRNA